MAGLGPLELGIVLAIVIIVFGVGRIGRIGKELGEGIKGFRQGVRESTDDAKKATDDVIDGETKLLD